MSVFGGAENLLQTGKPSRSLNLGNVLVRSKCFILISRQTGIQGYKIAKGEVTITDPCNKNSDCINYLAEIFNEVEELKKHHKNKFWTGSSKIWKNRKRVADGTTVGESGVRLSSPLVDYEDDDEEVKCEEDAKGQETETSNTTETNKVEKKKEKKPDYFGIAKLDDDYESEEDKEEQNQGTKRKLDELETQKVINVPESIPDVWNWQKVKYQNRYSSLSTSRCWKCRKTGHLPDGLLSWKIVPLTSVDCTASIGIPTASPSDPYHYTVTKSKGDGNSIYSPLLKQYYKRYCFSPILFSRCNKISRQTGAKCSLCSSFANLSQCLDCGQNFCDGSGHLIQHLRDFPSHNKLYSFKLKRQVTQI